MPDVKDTVTRRQLYDTITAEFVLTEAEHALLKDVLIIKPSLQEREQFAATLKRSLVNHKCDSGDGTYIHASTTQVIEAVTDAIPFMAATVPSRSFWVIERFENGKSAGYWDGGHSRQFIMDINKAIQFCRRDDAMWCIMGWHWKDVEITEHIMLSADAGVYSPDNGPVFECPDCGADLAAATHREGCNWGGK